MFEDIISGKSSDVLVAKNSSWIERFEWSGGTLTMVTDTGKEYQYVKVPLHIWEDLKESFEDGDSLGAFYNRYIKGEYREV